MTHQAPTAPPSPGRDPGRQIASLREALLLVRSICGEQAHGHEAALDEAARVSSAYQSASPVAQRRFDASVAEIAAWAAAGMEALLGAGGTPPRGPALRLAEELEDNLRRLSLMLPRS